jgi:hypothetical protein
MAWPVLAPTPGARSEAGVPLSGSPELISLRRSRSLVDAPMSAACATEVDRYAERSPPHIGGRSILALRQSLAGGTGDVSARGTRWSSDSTARIDVA